MAGHDAELKGPDLAEGIETAALADGESILGHAGGEAVLLVRRGDDWLAVGATCTHYSGPLGDGIVDGDVVVCPWHHACFDLRTGAAVGAPALDAIPRFEVERRGDRVRVRPGSGRTAAPERPGGNAPARPSRPVARDVRRVVVIGSGAAGAAAAEMLRREGFEGDVTVVAADADPPYDRPNLSKDFLAGSAPPEWIPLRPDGFYEEHGIALALGARVERIDREARTVVVEGGRALAWDRLILATGASPVRLDVPGADRPHVHVLRSLADSRAILERLDGARHAVVLGAGFIGLEVAASLRAQGLEVAVAAPEARPLERVLGPEFGDTIRALHEEHGVAFRLGEVATEIGGRDVTLRDGSTLAADLVVMGVGVRPETALAAGCGLDVDGGVVVDERLRTSDPAILAAGDVAAYPDRRSGERVRIEHWVVAQRQGQVAARNALGQDVPFDAVPFFWSMHYDTAIRVVGHAARWERIDVVGDLGARDGAAAFRRGHRTLAVATVGRDRVALEAEAAMARDDEAALDALIPAGR